MVIMVIGQLWKEMHEFFYEFQATFSAAVLIASQLIEPSPIIS